MLKEAKIMKKYKISAILGTILMGICSFLACISNNIALINIGNIGLLVSICIMSYGFSNWQP